jgi:catechol 2,3-dioxygenase-like lactoylglutathione lyase family enzyme
MSMNRGYQQRTQGAVNMSIIVERLDHLVLTVASIARTVAFYETVLGMTAVRFGPDGDRVALRFGDQKINLHEVGRELDLRAKRATAGSGDLCFIVRDFDAVADHLAASGVEIIEGPDQRSGALGPIRSIYFRDPDSNLIEVSTYEGA